MKDYTELHQRDVVELQDSVNAAAELSEEAKNALALHDNLMTLGCLNDFLLLIDLIDLDEVRYREVKDMKLSAAGVEQQKGADKFKKRIRRILTNKRDALIDILDDLEEEAYERFKEEGQEES
jgi:hypothetical protein